MDKEQKYTVTSINNQIKELFSNIFSEKIIVDGEISNLKISNNNLFLTLKDDESSINVISWGYGKLKNQIVLENGNKVSITGKITFYPKSGNFNLIMSDVEKIGLGILHNEYEKLKKKCEKLGYFEITIKKQIPKNIKNIGIVTAPEGAALQDILFVLKKNNFYGNVVIKRCMVQGNMCSKSIVQAIDHLKKWEDNDYNKLDIILITRGGGSFEDLMGFSDIKVIEEIHKCDIFTISAVGHEIDFMLSDFAADIRAPTPSIAAEIISGQQKNIVESFDKYSKYYQEHIKDIINNKIQMYHYKINNLKTRIPNPLSMIERKMEYFDNYFTNLLKIIDNKKNKCENKINIIQQKLDKYNINKMLNSGYVILLKGGKLCDSANNLFNGQKLKIKLKNGEADITIDKIKLNE